MFELVGDFGAARRRLVVVVVAVLGDASRPVRGWFGQQSGRGRVAEFGSRVGRLGRRPGRRLGAAATPPVGRPDGTHPVTLAVIVAAVVLIVVVPLPGRTGFGQQQILLHDQSIGHQQPSGLLLTTTITVVVVIVMNPVMVAACHVTWRLSLRHCYNESSLSTDY